MLGNTASGFVKQAARTIATAGLLGLAIAALLSGSDRQSREFPNSPSIVGWPYDTGAARAKAALAFVRTGPASAIEYARRAVLSDPLSAQAVSILGRSQLYAEQLPAARKTFEVAGQLGWRDAMTQIYWLDQALVSSDYKIAAERLDALLRQSPEYEKRDRFLAVVASTPEGRSALANRLKLSPGWVRKVVADVNDLPLDQVLQRVDIMRRTGKGVWDCPVSETIVQKLINFNMLDEAQSVWRLNCTSSGSLVYDGGFEHLDTLKATVAFDWKLTNRGDAEIALTQSLSNTRSLSLEVIAPISLPVIRQLIVLKPGRYRLTWRTPDTEASQARALRVALSCKEDLSLVADGTAVAGKPDMYTQDFTVDSECPARQLIFWLAPKAQVYLDDVTLDAI